MIGEYRLSNLRMPNLLIGRKLKGSYQVIEIRKKNIQFQILKVGGHINRTA